MQQIIIANPKGGCGKTTLATQIAGYLAQQEHRVALIDCDRQQSSLDWLKLRATSLPAIAAINATHDNPLREQQTDQFDWLVQDMPAGCDGQRLTGLLSTGDRLLIPILPSPTDIKACIRFLMALNAEQKIASGQVRVGLVANRVKSNTNYFKVLISFLEHVNMPLITSIRDTQNYIRAIDGGISIFDLPPSRVKRDIKQWQPLLTWLQVSHSDGANKLQSDQVKISRVPPTLA